MNNYRESTAANGEVIGILKLNGNEQIKLMVTVGKNIEQILVHLVSYMLPESCLI